MFKNCTVLISTHQSLNVFQGFSLTLLISYLFYRPRKLIVWNSLPTLMRLPLSQEKNIHDVKNPDTVLLPDALEM